MKTLLTRIFIGGLACLHWGLLAQDISQWFIHGSQHSGYRQLENKLELESSGYTRLLLKPFAKTQNNIQISSNFLALVEQKLLFNLGTQFLATESWQFLGEILSSFNGQLAPSGARNWALSSRLGLQWRNLWGATTLVLDYPLFKTHPQFDSNFFKLQQAEYLKIAFEHIWLKQEAQQTSWGFSANAYPQEGIYEIGLSAYKQWSQWLQKFTLQLGYGFGVPLVGVPAQKMSLYFNLNIQLL